MTSTLPPTPPLVAPQLAESPAEAPEAEVQTNPLGQSKLGTRRAKHVLLSEVSEAPWLLPRPGERHFKFLTSAAIRAGISAIDAHGMLVVPELVGCQLAAACRDDAEAALGVALSRFRSCGDSKGAVPRFRYASQMDMTKAVRAVLLAVRTSPPLASAIAAKLGDDAALCELSFEITDPNAELQPCHCATPAHVDAATTPYQAALAARGSSVMTILVALGDVSYSAGAPLVWPHTHTAAFHADVATRGVAPLREAMGLHADLRAGDALLTDSRLWRCGGAHAAGRRRTVLLAISFTSSSLFPSGRQFAMLSSLVGRFSLLNLESSLGRGGYGARGEALPPPARRVAFVPRPIASLLLTIASSSLPAAEPRVLACLAALRALLGAADPAQGDEPSAEQSAPSLIVEQSHDPSGEEAAARMVRVPSALLRLVRRLLGANVRADPRWGGLWRYVGGVLAAEDKAKAAKVEVEGGSGGGDGGGGGGDGDGDGEDNGETALDRELLRERWLEAHTGYRLSKVSEMRPPVDSGSCARVSMPAPLWAPLWDLCCAWRPSASLLRTQHSAGRPTCPQPPSRSLSRRPLAARRLPSSRGSTGEIS